jgi:hypothetical protein
MSAILAALIPTVIKAVLSNPFGSEGSKGLLTSKTIQGGVSLGMIPLFVFPLVDDLGLGQFWTALIKLVLMVAAFAWLVYGRATAEKPLGRE